MAELSKTAKASMKGDMLKKEVKVLTEAEMITAIRGLRPPHANLFVGNVLYVDALLAAYDRVLAENAELQKSNVIHDAANKVNAATIERLMAELEVAHHVTAGYQKVARQELELSAAKTETIAALAGEPGLEPTQGTDSTGE